MTLQNSKAEPGGHIKACAITFSKIEDILIKKAFICEVTPKGFTLLLNSRDLVSKSLEPQLNLQTLYYKNIHIYLPDMEMDLEGTVTGTRDLGAGAFEVHIEFLPVEPTYWRECLFDLWPKVPITKALLWRL